MTVIIENPTTGEERILKPLPSGFYPNFSMPWKVKATLGEISRQNAKNEQAAKISTMISNWGLPLSMSLSALRWLFGKHCPYCQAGGEFLKLLEDGKLTEAEARSLVAQVLNAKDQKNETALAGLRGRLEALRG